MATVSLKDWHPEEENQNKMEWAWKEMLPKDENEKKFNKNQRKWCENE